MWWYLIFSMFLSLEVDNYITLFIFFSSLSRRKQNKTKASAGAFNGAHRFLKQFQSKGSTMRGYWKRGIDLKGLDVKYFTQGVWSQCFTWVRGLLRVLWQYLPLFLDNISFQMRREFLHRWIFALVLEIIRVFLDMLLHRFMETFDICVSWFLNYDLN